MLFWKKILANEKANVFLCVLTMFIPIGMLWCLMSLLFSVIDADKLPATQVTGEWLGNAIPFMIGMIGIIILFIFVFMWLAFLWAFELNPHDIRYKLECEIEEKETKI